MNALSTTNEAALNRLAELSDQCVMCGLCLEHCPSYRVRRAEGESPRGRLAFAKAIATGALPPSARMRNELDDCLACGTCEAVCPVPVRYEDVIDQLRAILPPVAAQSNLGRGLRALLRRPRLLAVALRVARVVRRPWLRALVGVLPKQARALIDSAPTTTRGPAPVAFTAAEGERRDAVALFRGCAAAVMDADTQLAAAEVLSRLGYDVHAPQPSHCCGALATHEGAPEEARRLQHRAGELFAALPVSAVFGSASGCQRVLEQSVLGAGAIPGRELLAWLAGDARLAQRPLRIAPCHAVLHAPCTQADPTTRALTSILGRIAGLRVTTLPLQPRCCGAAGSYFVHHGDIAMPLRSERVEQILALAPDLVLTGNVGCRTWLEAGLREAGVAIPVRHPISLIAEAMES